MRVGLHDAPPVVQRGPDDQKPGGIGAVVLAHVAAKEGWQLQWVPGAWADLLTQLKAGQLDLLLPVSRTPERTGSMEFSSQSMHSTWGQLFVRDDRTLESLLELSGRRIAVVREDVFGAALRALVAKFDVQASWTETRTYVEAMKEVAVGRADAVALQRFADHEELDRHGLVGTPVVFHPTAARFAAPPGRPELLAVIDRELQALKLDQGSVFHREQVLQMAPQSMHQSLRWLWIALATAIFIAIVLILFVGLLRRRVRAGTREVGRLNTDLERRVALRTAELQQANADLESFTYSVSHDLRSPLRTMRGFLHLLQKRHADDLREDGQGLLRRALKSAERMDGLIEALLKLSRASRRDLTLHEVDVQMVVGELASDLLAAHPEGEGAAPVIEVAEDLPDCLADAGLLRQLFQNLLGNALKFAANSDPPRVWVEGLQDNGQVQYTVRDNGVGFDPKFKEDLFGLFRRLHPQSEFEGAGVGLALVARIVRRHGGTVTAEGTPGEGATFEVCIPSGAPVQSGG